MRIYTSALPADLRTVKAQGQRIAKAWNTERGIQVDLKAIKRTRTLNAECQSGFVVLESIFDTYLCHYKFNAGTLLITEESALTVDIVERLECPASLLAQATPLNAYWRECVQAYASACKQLTADRLAGNVTLFLLRAYETRQYSEPFFVVQKHDGEWFGIDCYGEKKYLGVSNSDLLEHCPKLIDLESQRPMDTSGLASDCVNTGVLIYKQDGSRAHLLGRPKTRAEVLAEQYIVLPLPRFDLHGEFAWA